jgi:hypothetical protein
VGDTNPQSVNLTCPGIGYCEPNPFAPMASGKLGKPSAPPIGGQVARHKKHSCHRDLHGRQHQACTNQLQDLRFHSQESGESGASLHLQITTLF